MELDSGHTQIVSEPKSERVQQTDLFTKIEHTYIYIYKNVYVFQTCNVGNLVVAACNIYIYTNMNIYTFGNVA